MNKEKRKEMVEAYMQIKTYMGVIQIANKTNGKIFVTGYPNLKNKWTTIIAQLEMGRFANLELQKDWNELGEDAFAYEELERKAKDDVSDPRWELKQMEKRWLEKLQPYGDKGYNRPGRHA